MKMFFSALEDGRVISSGTSPTTRNYIEVEVEAGSDEMMAPLTYRIEDGRLVKDDGLLKSEIQKEKELEQAAELERKDKLSADASVMETLKLFAQTLPEEEALVVADVYPSWEPGRTYEKGEIVRYGRNEHDEAQLYRLSKKHKSKEGVTPDNESKIFQKLGYNKYGVGLWIRPLGDHDTYMKGDVVWHKEKEWESGTDDNSGEPGVGSGWKERSD